MGRQKDPGSRGKAHQKRENRQRVANQIVSIGTIEKRRRQSTERVGQESRKARQVLQTTGERIERRTHQSEVGEAIVRGEIHSRQLILGKGQQEIERKGGKLEARKGDAQRQIERRERKGQRHRKNQRGFGIQRLGQQEGGEARQVLQTVGERIEGRTHQS